MENLVSLIFIFLFCGWILSSHSFVIIVLCNVMYPFVTVHSLESFRLICNANDNYQAD